MKKLALIVILAGAVFGASLEDNLTKLIETNTGVKVKIIQTESLKATKEVKLVVIEIEQNSQRVPVFATKDGNMAIGLSNLVFSNSSDDEALIAKISQETIAYNENSQKVAAKNLIEQLKPEQYIALKSSAKNAKTYFVIADPNCGYCKEELRNINDRLKTHNVNMVLVGILGADSVQKAAYAMNKATSSMSQKEKLNLLQETFSNNFKAPSGVDTSKIEQTTEMLFKSGVIQGVPFIYEQ